MYLLKTEGSQEYLFITDSIPDVICILYADDIANCVDTAINLQLQLNSFSDVVIKLVWLLTKIKQKLLFLEMEDSYVLRKTGSTTINL